MNILIILTLAIVIIVIYIKAANDIKKEKLGNQSIKKHTPNIKIENVSSSFSDARVKRVLDGDTVIIEKYNRKIRIRLDAIDCPESNQPWGNKATYGLIKLIGGKSIRLEEHGMDCYGRILGTIHVYNKDKSEWMNVNERMVVLGHAWVMRRFYKHLPRHRQAKLNSLEKWAKSKKIGLWKSANPIAPWEWRQA